MTVIASRLAVGLLASFALLCVAAKPSPARANSIDREAIRRVIRPRVRAMYACWAREAERGTALGRGRATVEFEIAPSGRVTRAKLTVDPVGSEPVTQCIVRVFLRMRFPTFPGTEPVIVRYPLWFDPDGSND